MSAQDDGQARPNRPLRCADDYGLGMYQGEPLVLVGMGGPCYHRTDHGVIQNTTTWTESFAREGLERRPCRMCFEWSRG